MEITPRGRRFARAKPPPPMEPLTGTPRGEEPVPVARVLIRVEHEDGAVVEYEAREPQDFRHHVGTSTRRTGLSIGAGDQAVPVSHAVPALSLSFTAHPRYNLHIRTHGIWGALSEKAAAALRVLATEAGYLP